MRFLPQRSVPLLVLIGLVTAIPARLAAVQILFDTAAPPVLSSALKVSDHYWPFHRFQVSSDVTLGSVGGYFRNSRPNALEVFGAIVHLSGPTDNPDSLDLTTPDLLGTTIIQIPHNPFPFGGEYQGNLNLVLSPGWYALVFGMGAFDASSSSFGVRLPSHAVDLAPAQLAVTAIQEGNPSGTPPGFMVQSSIPRFFATVSTDDDGDGVPNTLDVCVDTIIPENVPTRRLGVNRWALVDEDNVFDSTPPPGGGTGPKISFSTPDTAGCSCQQIIGALGLGRGHESFGCSISAMEAWVALANP